ncbi:hypothetical protein ACROYT_G035059 [Oculina patagonica]
MASSVEKELAKHLECGICLERFEEPKMLTCQHSYCKKCLERLVTRDEITCPECRRKTQVPSGDVKSLPTNFFINNLLSIRGNNQSNAGPPCEKHDGEILKLFCQTCEQLICRDCTVIDHRNHKYSFIKDIFPAVKGEILDIVKKSRANIRDLESSIETIKRQEDDMHKNSVEVNRKIDSFIDEQIELLEQKRQSLKDELQKSNRDRKRKLDAQMESFQTSLGCIKSSVEFTEEALTRGNEVEILSTKNQMIQQLTELNSVTSDLKPNERIYYSLETDSPLMALAALEKVAKIREYDEEYELLIKKPLGMTLSKDLRTERHPFFKAPLEKFYIRPKSKSTTLDLASKVQVTIISPVSKTVQVPVTSDQDGSFSFCFEPATFGDYKIKALMNGRYVHGSPFTWKVENPLLKKRT